MKTTILAAAAIAALGIVSARAEGNGGAPAGSAMRQAANGNPEIPATQWFAMSPAARQAMIKQLQERQAATLWPGRIQTPSAVAQHGAAPHADSARAEM